MAFTPLPRPKSIIRPISSAVRTASALLAVSFLAASVLLLSFFVSFSGEALVSSFELLDASIKGNHCLFGHRYNLVAKNNSHLALLS